MTDTPRCGDTVLHRPSGERWVVAWAEGENLAWCGWPDGVARLADCAIVRRCSDVEHRSLVQQIAAGCNGERAARVRRLYPDALAEAIREADRHVAP